MDRGTYCLFMKPCCKCLIEVTASSHKLTTGYVETCVFRVLQVTAEGMSSTYILVCQLTSLNKHCLGIQLLLT